MKKRRADEMFKKSENGKMLQSSCINGETTGDKKHQAARKRKLIPEHFRETEQRSLRKQIAINPERIREINKQTITKPKTNNPECIRKTVYDSVHA